MAGPRVVADEAIGGIKEAKQAIEVRQGVVEQGDLPACGGEVRGDFLETVPRPFPHGLAGAGMNDDMATLTAAGRGGGGRPTGCLREGPPMLRPMGVGWRG